MKNDRPGTVRCASTTPTFDQFVRLEDDRERRSTGRRARPIRGVQLGEGVMDAIRDVASSDQSRRRSAVPA